MTRLLLGVCCILFGVTLGVWFAPNYLRENRRILAAALIGSGGVLVACGFGLCLTLGRPM